ncbi:MAG: hypothetical protein C5B53_09915 [Candidatus Melainabacteria bacterium]|nr:MAG: hypothetical protein C5B53_09915 [Candidatus Melainabacteria bacterium]
MMRRVTSRGHSTNFLVGAGLVFLAIGLGSFAVAAMFFSYRSSTSSDAILKALPSWASARRIREAKDTSSEATHRNAGQAATQRPIKNN